MNDHPSSRRSSPGPAALAGLSVDSHVVNPGGAKAAFAENGLSACVHGTSDGDMRSSCFDSADRASTATNADTIIVAPYEIEEPDDEGGDGDDDDDDDNDGDNARDDRSIGQSVDSTSSNSSAIVSRWQEELVHSMLDLGCLSDPDGVQRGEKRKKSGSYLLRRHSSHNTGSNPKQLRKRRRKSKEKQVMRHGSGRVSDGNDEQFIDDGAASEGSSSSTRANNSMHVDNDENAVDVDAMDIT